MISKLFSIVLLISAVAVCQSLPSSPSSSTQAADVPIAELTSRAQAGDAEAEFALGRAYETATGVPQNDDRAFIWYKKAAEQGLAKAQVQVGIMCHNGNGTEKDLREALRWYQLAARQNNPAGLFNVAAAYYNGDGVGINDSDAYAFFLLAQEAGSKAADDGVTRLGAKMSAFAKHASYVQIGDMYAKGDLLIKDAAQAAKWYAKAADAGDSVAQVRMAELHDTGRGVPLDPAKGMMFCEAAAKNEFPPGQRCLAFHYQHGLGTTQDVPRALRLYKMAADEGDLASIYLLAQMYWQGDGVQADKISAYEYLLLANTSGDPNVARDFTKLKLELSEKEIKSGTDKAREWFTRHRFITGMPIRH